MAEIILGTDGSEHAERALAFAVDLAKQTGDRLTIVAVWQIPPGEFGIPYMGYVGAEVWDEYRKHADEAVEKAAGIARAAGVETETFVLEGAPSSAIGDLAVERKARMIVLGSHGWGGVRSALFGSVSRGVLHHAPCPVLVVPPPRD